MTSDVEIKWQNHTKFLILRDLRQTDGLLGLDIMEKLKITIDTDNRTLVSKFKEPVVLTMPENRKISPRTETVISFAKPWEDPAVATRRINSYTMLQ